MEAHTDVGEHQDQRHDGDIGLQEVLVDEAAEVGEHCGWR